MNRLHAIAPAIISVAAILLLASDSHAQVANYSPKVGEPHADFILPSIDDGTAIQLSAYRGKKVLLMHFASW